MKKNSFAQTTKQKDLNLTRIIAMLLQMLLFIFITTPFNLWPMDIPDHENNSTNTTLRGPENKAFNNIRVYHTTHAKDLYVEDDTVIGGTLKVNGSIVGAGNVNGPSSSTPHAIARFADTSGKILTNSPVLIDNDGNITGVDSLTAVLVTADLNGTASVALYVGNQSAANIAEATLFALTATNDNIYNTIIQRDNVGSFVTTMITLTGEVLYATDAATKEYVDTTAGSGIVTKTPALAMSTTNTTLFGLYSIDDVPLSADTRVLLTGQTDSIENGLWLAQVGAWTRPVDFGNPPTVASTAYVLTTSGTLYAGSGWICTTPTATIDTDALTFVQFSSPGSVTGLNVGTGTGTIFKDKTGNLINFKTLIAGDHLIITNNTDDVTLTVSAVSESLPNTLVLRDAFGNFSANTITAALTGTASENILRSGDTMTGTFTLAQGSFANPSLQFAGSNNTGLSAETPNTLVFSTNGTQWMSINETGTIILNQLIGSAGIVHNYADGALASTLITNDDIDSTAQIIDTKLATISTPGKVLDSATTATSISLPNTIVQRDSFGNFSANVITAAHIIGTSTENILRAGDTMTGTFTVVAGNAAQPSLQFVGSNNTGLSAEIPDTLVFSTNGIERMSINETGTVSIPGTLVLAAGTINQPSLQFANSLNSGLSSQGTGTTASISFSTNGVERMSIAHTGTIVGLDQTSITVTDAAFIIGNVLCMNSTQTATVISGDTVTINNGITTLVLSYEGNIEPLTINLPNTPIAGQLLTIKALRLTTGDLGDNSSITYNPAFNPASEAILELSPNANLAGNSGGASVTYIYLTPSMGAPSYGWYRYSRG